MGDIVNLRRVRKAKARAEAAAQASANRAKNGVTKAARIASERERASRDQALDGAKIVEPTDR